MSSSRDKAREAQAIRYDGDRLVVDDVDVSRLADKLGTPLWVYSETVIRTRYARIADAFDGMDFGIRYAVKANSNAAILRILRELGAGFDLVSGGEYRRARRIGALPEELVFAGVGKQDAEIRLALEHGVGFYHVESEAEYERLAQLTEADDRRVRVALRLNPDVPVDTHAYIATGGKESKFGVDFRTAARIVERIAANDRIELCAYHVHLGSLLFEVEPYLTACRKVVAWMDEAPIRSRGITHYDMGGGFGSRGPMSGVMLDLPLLAKGMRAILEPRDIALLCEPGRFVVGDAGVLVTSLIYEKRGATKDFYVVDAAMNDLIRPTLYEASHEILPVVLGGPSRERVVDVVGPVCESGDWLAKDRELPGMESGSRLAILQAGAYGMSMTSNYNSRPRAAEVLCRSGQARVIANRETLDDLWRTECNTVVEL